MLFLARQTGSSELQRNHFPGLAQPGTAWMSCGHGMVVSARVLGHFTCRMHMPGMHEEHWRHSHLCPSHHGYKQRRRNGLLHHAALVWQTKDDDDVTTITARFDVSAREDYPTRFSSAALNSLKRNV